jgi:general secretion pathway protein N
MTDRLLLLILTTGCLVFGSILFVELKPTGTKDLAVAEATARSDTPPAARRQQNPRIDELLTTILARPLFSSSRRPPQSAAAGASADSDLADTRLAGILTEPGRRIAIFAVSGDKPLRVAEGDAVSGWRIESITPREVSLSGPTGTKTLQPKLDPNLAPPPNQPSAAKPGRLPAPPGAARPGAPAAAAGVVQPGLAVPINNPGALPRPARPRQQR